MKKLFLSFLSITLILNAIAQEESPKEIARNYMRAGDWENAMPGNRNPASRRPGRSPVEVGPHSGQTSMTIPARAVKAATIERLVICSPKKR